MTDDMRGTPELSRPIVVDDLPVHGRTVEIRADQAECAAIARRLGLPSVASLEGALSVRPSMGREIHVEGTIRANLVQSCVVTGDPLEQNLEIEIQRRYSEGIDIDADDDLDADEVDPDADDREPIQDGIIDLGEAAVEELALQLPPYPRTPGLEFVELAQGPSGPEDADSSPAEKDGSGRENPFAVLADLKKRLETKE